MPAERAAPDRAKIQQRKAQQKKKTVQQQGKGKVDKPGASASKGESTKPNDAFEKWAQMLEGSFYHIPREEFEALNGIAHWHYYCVYMCMVSTNIFSKRHTTDRALEMNPKLADIAHSLEREYKALKELEQKLEKAKGGFSVTYEVLQDAKQCKKIAGILRQFPEVYTRICRFIESVSIGNNPQ